MRGRAELRALLLCTSGSAPLVCIRDQRRPRGFVKTQISGICFLVLNVRYAEGDAASLSFQQVPKGRYSSWLRAFSLRTSAQTHSGERLPECNEFCFVSLTLLRPLQHFPPSIGWHSTFPGFTLTALWLVSAFISPHCSSKVAKKTERGRAPFHSTTRGRGDLDEWVYHSCCMRTT